MSKKTSTPKRERVYIAGPMKGREFFNFPAFDTAAYILKQDGFDYDVVNPADMDRAAGFDPYKLPAYTDWTKEPADFDLRAAFKRDINAIFTCQAIYMLYGWQESTGARAEKSVADMLGLRWLNPPPSQTCLERAAAIVDGPRKESYGPAAENHQRTATIWSQQLANKLIKPITPEEVCLLNIGQKLSRAAQSITKDTVDDVCGFARNLEIVAYEYGRSLK